MTMNQTLKTVRRAATSAYSTAAGASRDLVQGGMKLATRNPKRTLISAVALGLLAAWAVLGRRGVAKSPATKRRA